MPDGRSRGMIYHLPGEQLPTPEQVFAGPLQSSEHYAGSSEHNGASSEHNAGSSEHKVELDMQRNDDGCLLSDHIDAPLIDALDRLDARFREKLEILAEEPRNRERMQKDRMQQVIITLCKEHYLTLNVMANLVKRSPDALRQQYLNGMVKSRQIQLAFPSKPTHERQAYKAYIGGQDEE